MVGSVWAATTISFSPTSINVSPGENFNLTISLNPQGVRNYTVKTEVNYPADLLEVKSFNFSNGWMAIPQSGYDLIDNTNGQLIKTAGYPGGMPTTATFGTISFSAKKAGSGIISLGSGSMALDADNQNILASPLAQASVKITAPAAPSTPPSAPTTPTAPEEEVTEEAEEEITPEEEEIGPEEETGVEMPSAEEVSAPEEKPSLLAGIGSFISTLSGWLIILGIFLLALYVLLILRKRKKY